MAYQEFTGQLDGEQPAAAAQATSFIPFDGKLDEPANAAPAPVKSLEAAPDDSNEAAMTNPMGDVAGTVDRVAQPEEKNQVGIIESAARAFPEGSAKFAKTAGLAASAPAVVFDYVKNAITGSKETTASDWAFSNFVQPWDKRAEFFAIKPEEKQNILGKIGSAIGSLGADLPYMIMSGGGAAEGEALQAVPKAAEYLATAVKRGFDAMRPVMIKAGSEKAEEVLNKGGSIDQAVAAGTTAALMTGAMGSAPMSVEGNFFKRLATGVPIGVVTTELQRQIQNAAMPDNMQQPFDAENLAVGSVTNALTAGVMGHPEQPAMPSRAELGYLPPKTAMADAVTGAYTGQPAPQPIINTARASAADIGAAKTMDEVINAATSAVPTLNPNAVRARSETAVSDLLKQIRPIEQGATDALPADAVRVLDGGDQGAENSAPGMESATPGSEAAGIPAEAGPANPAPDVAAHGNDLPGAEQSADAQPALKAEDAGIPIDQEWRAFPDNSGTLGIPRAEMPQIRAEHRGPMVNFLNARGIDHEQLDIPASDLKPTQQEFSPAKVQQAREYAGGDRSILVSSDGHVLDGHHQWLAKLEAGEPVKAIRLNAPIRDLIDQVREFPSAEVAEGAARALPGSEILAQQRFRPEHGQVSVIDPATLGGSGIGDKTISGGFARFVQALGGALGKDVYFFRQEGAKTRIDGFAPAKKPDAIFVNVHAGDAAWHYVAGHEFFHQMPEDLRTHFIDAVKPLVKPEAFKALKDYINQDHLNDAGHWEEIAADLFGNRFGEKAFFDQLAQRLPDRSVAARVFDYIRQFIDKMTQALQGAGKQFKTDRFVDDLEKVRAAAADALGRYLRNERAPEAAIGGRRVSEFSDKELDRFARSKGASGESARREIERRKQALADLSPAERRQQVIEALQGKTTRELREIAESDRRSYMRAAAADLLQERQEAISAKRSASARKFLQKQANIDADQDTMASAIAKLGGVNRESAAGRMRLAPEELNTKANVGNLARNIFVKGKGRRMDEMGELLAELGYVDRDEQGKHDQRDFEDKLARIAGGEEIYTPQGLMRRAEEMRAMEMKEVHADSPEEFAAIEQYADELEDWAAKHAVDLEKDPDLDAGDANPLITDEDIDAYFGSSKEESAGGTDQENPAKASQEGAETDRTAEKEFSLEQHDASDLKEKDARDNDRALAEKQLADSQRDAFTLTAPEGTVEGEANAMANTRQDNLFSNERDDDFHRFGDFTIDGGKLLQGDRVVGDMKIDIVEGKTPHVVVRDIRINSKGKGTGTEALNALREKAAQQGMPVALTTESMLGKAHQKRLRAYYERIGFVKNRGDAKVDGVREEYVSKPYAKLSSMRRVTPDDDTLHLDTPLSAQSYEIRRAIRNEIKRLRAEAWQMADFHGDPDKAEERVTGQDLLDRIADRLRGVEMAREYLHALGVPKIGDEDGVKSSAERKPVFFSQLDRAVDQVPAKVDNTSAANWKAWLLNNASKLGVKADEIKWSGISDYLDLLGKKKVSKDEIRDYLAQNGVKVQEVMKGEGKPQRLTVRENNGAWDIVDPDGRVLDTIEDRETAESDAEEMSAERYGESDTSYSKYTLPGGENYRELLLTLPQEVKRADPQEVSRVIEGRKKIFDEYQPRIDALKKEMDDAMLRGEGFDQAKMQKYQDLLEERDYRARDEVGEVPQDRVLPPKYKSGHWDEPNILAHVRFNDRTDADGKRVLFIEEMQSDYGQEGKKKGFRDSEKPWELFDPKTGEVIGNFSTEKEAAAEADKAGEQGRMLDYSDQGGKLPAAPFVTDTKSWLSLGLKRMIRYAAENGYDKVAFVNGEQSADRYDLSKRISNVAYRGGDFRAYDLDGNEVIRRTGVPREEVADLIGKEAAQKLFDQKPSGEGRNALYVLEGADLKVGGEGMKAFYDHIVPQVANDVLKKLGGGKVEPIEISNYKPAPQNRIEYTGGRYEVLYADGDSYGAFRDKADAEAALAKINATHPAPKNIAVPMGQQPGFDITPQLRDKALEGMPLFTTQRNPLRPDYDGPGAQFVKDARNSLKEIIDDALMKASPMSLGTDQARAIAKQWANNDRLARMQWTQFDNVLKKNYTDEQRREMWEAADEENVLRQQGLSTAGMGLDRLPADQRNTMETLHTYAEGLLQRARDAGMFQGDGLPYWTPRMAALIGEDGEYMRVPSGMGGGSSDQGRNIISSAPSLKQRKYLTAAETEAAMKTKFGENAEIVRDIRTMPLAMARLERAIAGRELINQIKELGSATGVPTFSPSDGPNFFTIDHPAFKRYQPRFVKDEDGNTVVATDQNGDPIFDRVPIYVSKDFEGPLRAIMSDKTGKLYQAFMNLKMKTMGLIMYSPLIHNAVEWGRALPVMPGKVATFRIYFEGNRVKNDPAQMRQAIKDGMVPIGQRGMNQDLVAMMNDPHLLPGKSLTAKLIGGAVGLVNEHAGTQVKKAIDKAGEIWHQTLLWDRVGDLQAGLYANMKETLIDKGLDEQSAGRLAAHFANRYAGALPNEAMSVNARKIANFVLFSRSFTLGNLGALKDIVTGMPKDVQSQIKMDAGEAALKLGKSIARKKAAMAFALDLALLYAGNSLLQDALDKMKRDKSLGEIGQGYADRLHRLVSKVKENPLSLVDPFYIPDHLSSTAENEPGKEDRIHYGDEDTGTAVYMRLPTGKIGEEFKGWIKSPLETIKRKEGTIMRPITQTIENDKGFGRRVYDPEAEGIKGAVKNLGRIVWNFMTQQVPADSIQAAADWASGHADETDKLKAAGPLVGLTFSKGAPGGPAVGEQYYVERKHQGDVMDIMPDVNRALKLGDRDRAIEMMENVKMTPQEILNVIRKNEAPESRLNNRSLKKFNQRASDEDKERMDRLRR
jgi:hypothetical protein